MSYTFSFADNGVYSAADVNKITSRLVTSGIEDPFTDGVPYNLSALNEAGTLLYTDGAVPETVNTLKVTKAEEEGTIFIYPGTAFFSDGSVIEIEAGGEMLSYTPGVAHYVYLKNDLINSNTSYPACTQEAPTGIYVMLAEISETGEITDKRTYAKGKLPGYSSSAQHVMRIKERISIAKREEHIHKSYDIGNNKYNYLLAYMPQSTATNAYGALGLYNISDGSYLSFLGNKSYSDGINYNCGMRLEALNIHQNNGASATAIVSFTEGTLSLDIDYYANSNYYVGGFDLELYVF